MCSDNCITEHYEDTGRNRVHVSATYFVRTKYTYVLGQGKRTRGHARDPLHDKIHRTHTLGIGHDKLNRFKVPSTFLAVMHEKSFRVFQKNERTKAKQVPPPPPNTEYRFSVTFTEGVLLLPQIFIPLRRLLFWK